MGVNVHAHYFDGNAVLLYLAATQSVDSRPLQLFREMESDEGLTLHFL